MLNFTFDTSITIHCILSFYYLSSPPTSERVSTITDSASPVLSAVSSPMNRSTASIPENVCEQNRLDLASLDYMQVSNVP